MYQVESQTRFCQQLKATVIVIVVCNVNLKTGDKTAEVRNKLGEQLLMLQQSA